MYELTDDYKKYVMSPAWKRKRAQYWASVGGKKCQACGARTNLHVHHKTYARFKKELMVDLCGLCQVCHREVHKLHKRTNRPLASITNEYVYSMKRNKTLKSKRNK